MARPKILVTGGGGFIGSHIVDALLEKDAYDVRVLDNFSTGRRENLMHCMSDIELFEGDIRDLETVEEAVEGVWCILHEAALPSVPRSIKAPITSNEVNAGGTLQLLSAAHRAGVQRVVYASSSSVYGDTEELPKRETNAPQPLSPYAVSKLAGENYVRVFAGIYGMETISLRYFNVFGPRQDPTSQYSGVVAKFTDVAIGGDVFTVFGDGLQARDFTYVLNVVQANVLAVEARSLRGEIVNVACGSMASLLDMAAALNRLVDREIPVEYGPARLGDVRFSQADIEQAKAVLGYEPSIGLEEGLGRTLDWRRGELNGA